MVATAPDMAVSPYAWTTTLRQRPTKDLVQMLSAAAVFSRG